METFDLYAGAVSSFVFSERFWFPDRNSAIKTNWTYLTGTTRSDNVSGGGQLIRHPRVGDMKIVLPLAFALILVRYVAEAFVFKPLARRNYACVNDGSGTFGNVANDRTAETKFGECSWRGTFKLLMTLYGLYVLIDEHFFYDVRSSFERTWPHHHIKDEFLYYYMIEAGFYLQLLLTMRWDMQRKSISEHILHHLITISLLFYSWVGNFVRIGLLVMLCFDHADPWLESSKAFRYIGHVKMSKNLFYVYALSFAVSRLALYPYFILYTCWSEYVGWCSEFGHWPSALVMTVFLTVLFGVQLSWAQGVLNAGRRMWRENESEIEAVKKIE